MLRPFVQTIGDQEITLQSPLTTNSSRLVSHYKPGGIDASAVTRAGYVFVEEVFRVVGTQIDVTKLAQETAIRYATYIDPGSGKDMLGPRMSAPEFEESLQVLQQHDPLNAEIIERLRTVGKALSGERSPIDFNVKDLQDILEGVSDILSVMPLIIEAVRKQILGDIRQIIGDFRALGTDQATLEAVGCQVESDRILLGKHVLNRLPLSSDLRVHGGYRHGFESAKRWTSVIGESLRLTRDHVVQMHDAVGTLLREQVIAKYGKPEEREAFVESLGKTKSPGRTDEELYLVPYRHV